MWPAGSPRRRDAVGSGGHPGDRQPPRLADDRRADARGARRAGAVRRGGARRRTGRHRAAGHGRLLARAGGAAPLVRARQPTTARAAARAGLDRRRQDPRDRAARWTSSARCSSSPRSPAARSSRCRCSRTSSRSSSRGQALRRDHRPRLGPGSARRASTASGGRSPAIRTSAGATARCPRSASCRAR